MATIWYVCPADGHPVKRELIAPGKVARADSHCPNHGVRLFRVCKSCKAPWPFVMSGYGPAVREAGADFCKNCGSPAPWLSRADLMKWLQHQVQASHELEPTTRLELREVLEKLQTRDANDTRTASAWKKVRDTAPKVWAATKQVRDVLIGEAVKVILGR